MSTLEKYYNNLLRQNGARFSHKISTGRLALLTRQELKFTDMTLKISTSYERTVPGAMLVALSLQNSLTLIFSNNRFWFVPNCTPKCAQTYRIVFISFTFHTYTLKHNKYNLLRGIIASGRFNICHFSFEQNVG